MVDGEVGHLGVVAAKPVEVVIESKPDHAQTQVRNIMAKLALVYHNELRHVELKNA